MSMNAKLYLPWLRNYVAIPEICDGYMIAWAFGKLESFPVGLKVEKKGVFHCPKLIGIPPEFI
jgi:hypothetical protein